MLAAFSSFAGTWVRADVPHPSPLRIAPPTQPGDGHSVTTVSFQGRSASARVVADTPTAATWSGGTAAEDETTAEVTLLLNWGELGHPAWGKKRFTLDGPGPHGGGAAAAATATATMMTMTEREGGHPWRRLPSLLTHAQLASFRRDGFLVLRQAVPQALVCRARRAVLADLGQNYNGGADFTRMSAQSFAPGLRADDGGVLTDLVRLSLVQRAAEELVGRLQPQQLQQPPQIAVRFPTDPRLDGVAQPALPGMHIDGVPTAHNGVTQYSPFTALVGVALSDQLADFEGNLVVRPGSHVAVAAAFAANLGTNKAKKPHPPAAAAGGGDSDSRGGGGTDGGDAVAALAPAGQHNGAGLFPDGVLEHPATRAPVQLHLRAGDAVVAHYLLVHGVAENRGANLRINTYWRVYHREHARRLWSSACRDPAFVAELWSGFDAVAALSGTASPARAAAADGGGGGGDDDGGDGGHVDSDGGHVDSNGR